MYPVDLKKFWEDDALSHEENCFSKKAPQVAMGIRMRTQCVFAELGEEGEPWGETERERKIALNKRYNDIAEEVVGIRLLNENLPPVDAIFPAYKRIGEVFGGIYTYRKEGGEWLHSNINTPKDLELQIEKIEKMDVREFILPPSWDNEKRRIFEKYGKKPEVWREIRGPVTLASSIFGVENLLFLYYDEPELFERFSRTVLKVIMEYITIFNEEAGYTEENAPRGFRFKDDNCVLLTPEMYEVFAYPILKTVFDRCSPGENDERYQHSDSAMGHLLPILGRLNLTGCNFGPTLTVREIRTHMPKTRIDGQLSPLTFLRNEEENIIREVIRDCEMAKENDLRGVNIYTAGSIENGALLSSMRTVMYAIQRYGRY